MDHAHDPAGHHHDLTSSATLMSQFIAGDNITALSPLGAVSKLNGRPVYITHGDADTRLSVQYTYDLADAIRANGEEYDERLGE